MHAGATDPQRGRDTFSTGALSSNRITTLIGHNAYSKAPRPVHTKIPGQIRLLLQKFLIGEERIPKAPDGV
jgi:hypothetical protein